MDPIRSGVSDLGCIGIQPLQSRTRTVRYCEALVAQVGRAEILVLKCGGVVPLVRTPACHAGGRGFESRRSRHVILKHNISEFRRQRLPFPSRRARYAVISRPGRHPSPGTDCGCGDGPFAGSGAIEASRPGDHFGELRLWAPSDVRIGPAAHHVDQNQAHRF